MVLNIEGGFIHRLIRPGSRKKEHSTIVSAFKRMLENEEIIDEINWYAKV